MFKFILITLGMLFSTEFVLAGSNYKVKPDVVIIEYPVSGKNLEQIKSQIKKNGPDSGKWGLTKWNITWTPKCEITLTAKVTLPKLLKGGHSEADEYEFKRMLIALRAHEMQHVYIGVFAAEELKRSNCSNPKRTTDYWKKKNKELDKRTVHGNLYGVWLRRVPKGE